jgi:hypothetical protein
MKLTVTDVMLKRSFRTTHGDSKIIPSRLHRRFLYGQWLPHHRLAHIPLTGHFLSWFPYRTAVVPTPQLPPSTLPVGVAAPESTHRGTYHNASKHPFNAFLVTPAPTVAIGSARNLTHTGQFDISINCFAIRQCLQRDNRRGKATRPGARQRNY